MLPPHARPPSRVCGRYRRYWPIIVAVLVTLFIQAFLWSRPKGTHTPTASDGRVKKEAAGSVEASEEGELSLEDSLSGSEGSGEESSRGEEEGEGSRGEEESSGGVGKAEGGKVDDTGSESKEEGKIKEEVEKGEDTARPSANKPHVGAQGGTWEEFETAAPKVATLYKDSDELERTGDDPLEDRRFAHFPALRTLLRKYRAFHKKNKKNPHAGRVYVRPVGQLCNRLMTITSGFVLALLTGKVLEVEDTQFYASMNDLFQDPGFQWLARAVGGDVAATIRNPNRPPWRETEPLLCGDLRKAYPGSILLQMNQYMVPYLAWNPHYRPAFRALFGSEMDIFTPLAHFLFTPTAELRRMRDDYTQKHFAGRHVVGLQVRSGGDFTSHPMTRKDWELYGNCGRGEKEDVVYFVATDTEQGRERAKEFLGEDKVVFGPGEFLRSNHVKGVQMALLDILLLAEADTLVTTAWSSFGYMAAGLRGRETRLVTDHVDGGEVAAPPHVEQYYMGVVHKSDRRVKCAVLPSHQPCFHKFANWGAREASCFRPEMVEKEMLGGRYC